MFRQFIWVAFWVVGACGGAKGKGNAERPETPWPSQGTALPPASSTNLEDKAKRLVLLVNQGKALEASSDFDATMRASLPPEKLQKLWSSIVDKAGKLRDITATRTTKQSDYDVVFVTCQFEKYSLDAKVVFSKGQVAGLFFLPPGKQPTTSSHTLPPYAAAGSFKESDITIGAGEWQLPGTLTTPFGEGSFPVVIFVHGSGPHDRDETIGPNKPFRDLALGLAARGIASIRYDKRTKVHASKLAGAGNFTIQEESIEDAILAIQLAATTPQLDSRRIFVLGHSLGGYIAPRIAKQAPQLKGAIILAGSARPLEELILEQVDYLAKLDGNVSDVEKHKLDELRTQLLPLTSKTLPKDAAPILGVPASYWRDLQNYDPVALMASLSTPVLVLQGARDYQVTTVDYEKWQKGLAGRKASEFQLFDDLNHLFMSGTGKGTPAEYEQPGFVAQPVIAAIATWVASH